MRAAVDELRRSFAVGNWRGMCDRLTRPAQRQAGTLAHGSPGDCLEDVEQAFALVRGGGGFVGTGQIELGRVEIDGDRAAATIALGHWAHSIPLAYEDGAWRVDSFFGSAPAEAARATTMTPTAPFPAPAGMPAEGLDPAGGTCFGFFEDYYPEVSGNCELVADGELTVTLLTAFGAVRFADCEVEYHAWVDGQGRTWTDFLHLTAPQNNGCSDIRQCRDHKGQTPPWRGRITANDDSSFTHRARVCLRTCIGYYVGDLDVRLVRTGKRWRVRASSAGVGASGIRFDGGLAIEPGFKVRAAGA